MRSENEKSVVPFQALTDHIRIRVIRLLATVKTEACLCELVDSLLEPEYKLSRHIKILKQAGFLESEKQGRWVYHRLGSNARHYTILHEAVLQLPDEGGIFKRDLSNFRRRLKLRTEGRCQIGIQDFATTERLPSKNTNFS